MASGRATHQAATGPAARAWPTVDDAAHVAVGAPDEQGPPTPWILLKRTTTEWIEDKAPKQAAALAYYLLFALGPILLVAASVAGLVFGATNARAAISQQVERLLGAGAKDAVESLMNASLQGRSGYVGLALGVVLLFFGAIGVFGQLRDSLDTIWEVQPRKVTGFKARIKDQLRRNLAGLAGVMGFSFLLIVSLAVSAGLSALGRYAQGTLPGGELLWQVVNFAVATLVLGGLFMAIFKFVPDARVAWRDVAVGGLLTGAMFVLGELLIGVYLGHGPTATRYGAASSVLVVLLWTYYSGLMLFYGAEFTQVFANLYGSRVEPSSTGVPLRQAVAQRQGQPDTEGAAAPDSIPSERPSTEGPMARSRPATRRGRPAKRDHDAPTATHTQATSSILSPERSPPRRQSP